MHKKDRGVGIRTMRLEASISISSSHLSTQQTFRPPWAITRILVSPLEHQTSASNIEREGDITIVNDANESSAEKYV